MTKRFCDKCGAEAQPESIKFMWYVRETGRPFSYDPSGSSKGDPVEYDVCAKCADAIKEALPK